jgi:hypothetical protein
MEIDESSRIHCGELGNIHPSLQFIGKKFIMRLKVKKGQRG